MARISRKAKRGDIQAISPQPETIYRTAAYVRLSVEGSDQQKNQESIAMQQYMLEAYIAKQPDMLFAGTYQDNGESGTSFARPGFERLMMEVRKRTINCIVVKDLSRFGRNYIETGYYLEKIFPGLGIRFIAVNDHYDTLQNKENEMLISLKNLMNDLYAKDISQKIHSAFTTMRENGEYTGGPAPYGYKKSPENKHKLIIDPKTAPIVRNIFQWRLEGMGWSKIARRLNEQSIPCPAMNQYDQGYRKEKPTGTKALWKGTAVCFLATNPVYAGHMAQGKMKKKLYDSTPATIMPRSEWTVVKNTHEAIIDQNTFDQVQNIKEQRYKKSCAIRGKYATTENIWKGLLICADCGTKMIRHKSVSPAGTPRYVFICRIYEENKSGQGCSIKSIGEPELMECVLQSLQAQIKLVIELEKFLKKLQEKPEFRKKDKDLTDTIVQIQQKQNRNIALRSLLFEAWSDNTLTEAEYLSMKTQYGKEMQELNQKLAQFQEEKSRIDNFFSPQNHWISILKKYGNETTLTREAILTLIKQIKISGYNQIEIMWNFQDEFTRLADKAKEVCP